MTEPTVHVVDDDEPVREALAFLLRGEGFAVKTYASAEDLLSVARSLDPGCILTDIRMPGLSGIDLMRQLRADGVDRPTIVMTGHADVPLAVEAMKAGALDFIEKPLDDELVLGAIGAALGRASAASPTSDPRAAQIRQKIDRLTAREQQVLAKLVEGKPNKIIAYELDISPRTVEVYRANVMTKMQAGSLSELVRMAMLAERG